MLRKRRFGYVLHELREEAPGGRFALHLRGAEREFQHAAAAEFSGAAAVLRAAAVRPVTPVHGILKRFASSKLFFMCALLFTVQVVVSAGSHR